jgi:hypothetical protein
MPVPTGKAIERLHEEAKDTVASEVELGQAIDDKASEVLRFNALLIGIVATGVSIATRLRSTAPDAGVVVVATSLGTGLLVVSTALAILAYHGTRFRLGTRADDLERVATTEATEEDILLSSFRGHAESIRVNRATLDRASRRLRGSLWTLLLGLTVLFAATATIMLA